jgi:hypothetical protein
MALSRIKHTGMGYDKFDLTKDHHLLFGLHFKLIDYLWTKVGKTFKVSIRLNRGNQRQVFSHSSLVRIDACRLTSSPAHHAHGYEQHLPSLTNQRSVNCGPYCVLPRTHVSLHGIRTHDEATSGPGRFCPPGKPPETPLSSGASYGDSTFPIELLPSTAWLIKGGITIAVGCTAGPTSTGLAGEGPADGFCPATGLGASAGAPLRQNASQCSLVRSAPWRLSSSARQYPNGYEQHIPSRTYHLRVNCDGNV